MKGLNLLSFQPWLQELPVRFIQALETNFGLVSRATEPFAVTLSITLTPQDFIDSVQANATSAAFTVYLPSQPNGNRRRRVIKTDASANAVTVSGNGSLINGSATYVLAAQYDKVDVEPTGSGWLIVN